MRRRALGGEVDTVRSLELDFELSCGIVSMRDAPDLQQRGRSPC
jgi:hypothetical protein